MTESEYEASLLILGFTSAPATYYRKLWVRDDVTTGVGYKGEYFIWSPIHLTKLYFDTNLETLLNRIQKWL